VYKATSDKIPNISSNIIKSSRELNFFEQLFFYGQNYGDAYTGLSVNSTITNGTGGDTFLTNANISLSVIAAGAPQVQNITLFIGSNEIMVVTFNNAVTHSQTITQNFPVPLRWALNEKIRIVCNPSPLVDASFGLCITGIDMPLGYKFI